MTINNGVDLTADLINNEFAALLTAFGQRNTVSTDESRNVNSYAALATAGPAVTITSVGTRALIMMSFRGYDGTSAANNGCMAVAISGATTLAASDANALIQNGNTAASGGGTGGNYGMIFSVDINAGSNTYTCQYKSPAASAYHFVDRKLFVFAP